LETSGQVYRSKLAGVLASPFVSMLYTRSYEVEIGFATLEITTKTGRIEETTN